MRFSSRGRSMAKRGNEVRKPSPILACEEKGEDGRWRRRIILRKGSRQIFAIQSPPYLCSLFLASSAILFCSAHGVRGKDSGLSARKGPAMAVCTSLLGLRTAAFGGGESPCRREKNVERACKKRTTIVCYAIPRCS